MAIRLRFLEPLLALVLTATLFGSCVAHAQTVQPTYIRPSKGSNIQVFSGQPPAAFTTSPIIYDFSAFAAVQVVVASTPVDPVACRYVPEVYTYGSLTKTENFGLLQVENADFKDYYTFWESSTPTGGFIAYTVNSVQPFIQFAWRRVNMAAVPPGPICTFTVTMTPIPFQTGQPQVYRNRKAIPTTSGTVIPFAPAFVSLSTILTLTPPLVTPPGLNITGVRLQNLGTYPIMCAYQTIPTVSTADFILPASTTYGAGLGGSIELLAPKSLADYNCSAINVGAPAVDARYLGSVISADAPF